MPIDDFLSQVSKPTRYIGREWNSCIKDWDKTKLHIALAYPDVYEIGLSNLAIPILYHLLNQQPDVLAERAYAPWPDMEAVLRRQGLPLFSLESKRPLKDFDVMGFSLGHELIYTNVLNMLDLAGIPVLAAERSDSHPLIIAGGSCVLNPEPMADFIDLFVLGEGEEVVLELVELLRQAKGMHRRELLLEAAKIEGIYVPSLYRVEYDRDGFPSAFYSLHAEAKPKIEKRWVAQLPPPLTSLIVPYMEVVHDRGVVEIQRGCSRGCRFCQAGFIYRPVRERPVSEVVEAATDIVRNCGYRVISLLSLSTSDYSGIEGLVGELARKEGLSLSLPSLRMDHSSVRLMDCLPQGKKKGLTFAPEAGSDRLRQVVNKGLKSADILETMDFAFHKGWTSLKLYFILGLPTETAEDIEGIIDLARQGISIGGRGRIKVSTSLLVAKAHTPFQWLSQLHPKELVPQLDYLSHRVRRLGADFSWHDPGMSFWEGILSRGDRRLGQVIYNAWRLSGGFDAWNDHFRFEHWEQALAGAGLAPELYTRQRGLDEPLPWDLVDTGLKKAVMKREYLRAFKSEETPDCRLGP
ncbi:MAG: TIGR03960 family B12-binding radical SAM protein, partial [Chloroflexota bacterium]